MEGHFLAHFLGTMPKGSQICKGIFLPFPFGLDENGSRDWAMPMLGLWDIGINKVDNFPL
jgi:hypothetical protein